MSDAEATSPSRNGPPSDDGVLANLPRTRPQRSSARRAAARKSSARGAAGASAPTRGRDGAGRASPERERSDRARPDRARPARARTAAAGSRGAAPETARPQPTSSRAPAGKRKRSDTKRPAGGSAPDAAPRQGFESEGETMSGTVMPPGGAELAASAAELIGELAKAGLSSGERVLKDVFSRLRPS